MVKKLIRIIIVIIAILLILYIGFIIKNKLDNNKKDYEIEQIQEKYYFVVKQQGKTGVIDANGNYIIEPKYDNVKIPNPSKDIFICYENGKSIALNKELKHLFAEYKTIEPISLNNTSSELPYEKSVLKSEKNGKYGLINFDGEKIVDTIYEEISGLSRVEGQLVVKKDGKYGIMNIKGIELIKNEYDEVSSDNYYNKQNGYREAGYIVGVNSGENTKYGYINSDGKRILKLEFDSMERVTSIENSEEIFLITENNGQFGIYRNNKMLLENEYQSIEYESDVNGFIVEKNQKYGVADLNGNIIVPIENVKLEVKGQSIYVQKNGNSEVYDKYGKLTNLSYNMVIKDTENDNYKITIETKGNDDYYGLIDQNGNVLIENEYLYVEYVYDNYFIVCGKNGKFGIMDGNKNVVLELKYDLIQKMHNKNIIQTLQKSEVNITELYAENMKRICYLENAIVENKENYIKAYSNSDTFYFDDNGIEISNFKLFPNNKLFAKKENGKWGFVDKSGNIIVQYEYDRVTEFNEYGFAAIKKDSKWGCIDSTGRKVIEPTYEIDGAYGGLDFIGKYYKVQSGFGDLYYTDGI